MADVGGGGRMPAHLLERLVAREAQRKTADTATGTGRRRGAAVVEDSLLPSLKLEVDPSEEAEKELAQIFASPLQNTPSFFLEHMARAKSLLLHRIERLKGKCDLGVGAPEPAERVKLLDDLLNQIEELQRWFTESSPHLKPFHVEQARQDIDEIKSCFHEVRAAVLPKKKFTFGSGPKSSAQFTEIITTNTSTVKQPLISPVLSSLTLPKFTLSHLSHRHDLHLPSTTDDGNGIESLQDQSLCLTDLFDCDVDVTSACGNLMASRLTGCTIRTLQPVASSVMLQDCVDCRFVLSCRQLRVHRTRATRFDIFVASAPVIEDSTDLLVGPWNDGSSDTLGSVNHWKEVQDFSCPTLVAEKATLSPNWSLLPESEWLKKGRVETDGDT